MKIEHVEIFELALLVAFVLLMTTCTVCVLTEHIAAAFIVFVATLVIGAVASTPAIEYVNVEYYYEEEAELD